MKWNAQTYNEQGSGKINSFLLELHEFATKTGKQIPRKEETGRCFKLKGKFASHVIGFLKERKKKQFLYICRVNIIVSIDNNRNVNKIKYTLDFALRSPFQYFYIALVCRHFGNRIYLTNDHTVFSCNRTVQFCFEDVYCGTSIFFLFQGLKLNKMLEHRKISEHL